MKVLLLATVFTFSIQAAFADCKLPGVLRRNLDDASVKTSTRILGLKSWDRLSNDKIYKEGVQTETQKILAAVGFTAMAAGTPHSVAGTGAFLTSSTSGHPYDEGALATGRWWANLVDRMGGANVTLAMSGVAMAGSISAMAGFHTKDNAVDKKYLLNNDGVDKFVADTAARLRVMFSLSKEKEATIRTAIREAIAADAQKPESERHPISVYEIARNAKYAGKSVLSAQDQQVLTEIETALNAKELKSVPSSPEVEDRIRSLVVGTAMIEEFTERPDAARDGIIKANRNLLGEISAFRKANCGVSHAEEIDSDEAKSGDAN